ncbi:TonB-dependent receptor [Thermodesulfobacteriota bacterium]
MRTTVDLLKKINITALVTTIIIFMILPSASALEDESVFHLDDIVVVATRNPAPAHETPSSVSAFDSYAMESAGISLIGDAALYVPNVNMVEFTERILSQPYFRGIGSGPNNPAVTTYIDGVPQLHGYSANVELLDVTQVEFLRGAQGMLYGRNTVGGVIHILSRNPNLSRLEYAMEGEYGSYNLFKGKFRISGPLNREKLGLSLAVGYSSRDGYSDNLITGKDLDSRESFSSKLQLLWLPADNWSARIILFTEQDRDGDYALSDLSALRGNPHVLQQDFEGYTDRDILAPTLELEYSGDSVDFISISGLVKWETHSATDLDYSPLPALTRESMIRNLQLSQEFRWSSSKNSPIILNGQMKLAWQVGALFFLQEYRETSVNNIAIPFPLVLTSPLARLEDRGFGAYLNGILTIQEVWDLALGIRCDHEGKEADLQTFYTPAIAPSTALNTDRNFTEVSPRLSLTRVITPGRMIYGSINSGYRVGGFNPVSPPGSEAYDEAASWNYEIGVKTSWMEDRLRVNLALFHISWDHLQLNLPIGQSYYISNVGDAESTGFELELFARPVRNWDIFGSIGFDRARFGDGTASIQTDAFGTNSTINISDHHLIFTPEFTASIGTQYSWELGPDSRVFIRAEITGYGRYFYNTANTASQDSHSLVNLRAGYKTSGWFVEAWAKNLFDTDYIPVAFEFPNGRSGFLGENGAPLMVGLRAGLTF